MTNPISEKKCAHPDCNEPRAYAGRQPNGKPIYRRKCDKHYKEELAEKRGFSSVSEYQYEVLKRTALRQGFSSVSEYQYEAQKRLAIKKGFSSLSEYRIHEDTKRAEQQGISLTQLRRNRTRHGRHQKTYCENIDGRLGYVCTTHIILDVGMLQVDHIDGNSANECVDNYQTLCACCHAYKSNVNKDYATPGRKTLKQMRQQNNSMSFH